MFNSGLQAIKKQIEFRSRASEKFVYESIKKIAKLVEVIKTKKERQKNIPLQLSTSFNKLQFWSILNKNRVNCHITGIEIAIIAKVDKLQTN